MNNFELLGLPNSILSSLKALNIETPTPIQSQTIPLALEGKDVLGSAQTGTGKTFAFGIPLVTFLLNNSNSCALVLAPTRELATQVHKNLLQLLGERSHIKSALIIGGDSIVKQLSSLKRSPRLVVGTPGRVNDHIMRGSVKFDKTDFLVLDETDRMLDMGFTIQLAKILQHLPQKRQTLMFSATISPTIERIASTYLHDPILVSVGEKNLPSENVKQEIIQTAEGEKYKVLQDKLDSTQGSVIVFVKTKISAEKIAEKLRSNGHVAEAIHGDLRQRSRDNVINAFRRRKSRILVATDVASRGLDIPNIEYVVNYDLPSSPEDYIHRIGRTGRAGNEGIAVSLVTKNDRVIWKNICRLMDPNDEFDAGQGGRAPKEDRKKAGPRRFPKGNFRDGRKGGLDSARQDPNRPRRKRRAA